MLSKMKTLILGASYGSLLGVKIALAGHDATLVCLPQEAALINAKARSWRMPVIGRDGLVEVTRATCRGSSTPRDRRGESARFRPHRARHAEPHTARPRARAARRGGESPRAVHVDHEHAATAYLARIPASIRRVARTATPIRRCWRASIRRPSSSAARTRRRFVARPGGERAAGAAADQFQGGALRFRRAHGALRESWRPPSRTRVSRGGAAGEAQVGTSRCSCARQVGDDARGTTLRAPEKHGLDPRCRALRRRATRRSTNGCSICACRSARAATTMVPFEKYAKAPSRCKSPSSAPERSPPARPTRARRSPGAVGGGSAASASRRSTRSWRWSTRGWFVIGARLKTGDGP